MDASPSVFSVLAAINSAGYDAAIDSPSNHPLRAQIRAEIARRKPAVLFDLQRFYREHKLATDAANLNQYMSFALTTSGPPDFGSLLRQNEAPPDVQRLEGFADLMKRFHREAGIDEFQAELLPEDKLTSIEQLVDAYQHVAMIGDGVNDAPAMARSSIGIAMGAIGSDAAIEAADIALMSDDLSKLPWLIRHSKRALSIIRQNITLSLAVKAMFVVLTFTGFASLWAAIAADMGVSLLVILNALRLLGTSAAQ